MTATISAQWVTAHFPLRTFTGNWSVAFEMNNSLEEENYLDKEGDLGWLPGFDKGVVNCSCTMLCCPVFHKKVVDSLGNFCCPVKPSGIIHSFTSTVRLVVIN